MSFLEILSFSAPEDDRLGEEMLPVIEEDERRRALGLEKEEGDNGLREGGDIMEEDEDDEKGGGDPRGRGR